MSDYGGLCPNYEGCETLKNTKELAYDKNVPAGKHILTSLLVNSCTHQGKNCLESK